MLKYILLLLTLSIALQAQQFDGGKDYYYTVKSSKYEKIDTLALLNTEMFRKSPYISTWKFDARKTANIISKQSIPIFQSDTTVLLKMPTTCYLSDLGKVPYPQLNFSMEGGDSIYVEQSYVKRGKDFLDDSIKIKGYVKLVDYQEKFVNDEIIKIWTLEAYNSEDLEYRATYTYSSEYGFVNFKYFLAGVEIEIDHYSTYHTISILEE